MAADISTTPSFPVHSQRVAYVPTLEAQLFSLTCHCQLYASEMASEAQILKGLEGFSGSQEQKVIKGGRSNQLCQMLLVVQ